MNKLRAKIFFFIFFLSLGWAGSSLAAPSVSSATQNIIHGQNISITGSDFGIKDQAAPVLWDDCEGRIGALTLYDDHMPRSDAGEYETKYRTIPYRGMEGPHNRSATYIAGGHGPAPVHSPQMGITKTARGESSTDTSDTWYMSWYVKVEWPLRGTTCADFGINYKHYSMQQQDAIMTGTNLFAGLISGMGNEEDLSDALTGNGGSTITYNGNIYTAGTSGGLQFDIQRYAWRDQDVYDPLGQCVKGDVAYGGYPNSCEGYRKNERQHWIREEVIFSKPVGIWGERAWGDGDNSWAYRITGVENFTLASEFSPRSVSIGAYARGTSVYYCNDAWRFFDDIYIDTELSRVMLCDNAVYENSTVCEPQIPSAWNNNVITAKVNLGALPDSGQTYLYVFDSENNRNADGYRVTLGSSGGDTIAPAAPSGVIII